MSYEIPIEKLGDGFTRITNEVVCKGGYIDIFYYFVLPLLICFLILLLIKYREIIKISVFRIYSKAGYIRIYFIMPNKRLVQKLIKLDKFNNFVIGKRRFNLEKMYSFLIGYDKYNFPIFMYDYQFILPLTITVDKVTEQIKEQLGEALTEDEISAITMKIDSSTLKTVYDKKLMSDLYSISGDDSFKKTMFWVIVGALALGVLYYTGYLEVILSYLT